MCISIGRSAASFSSTKLYVGEAYYNDKYVHVVAYQNIANSGIDTPNAMIIPFPTDMPMGSANILDTTKYRGFLNDITNATRRRSMMLGGHSKSYRRSVDNIAQVFDVGSYTVILADHVIQVPEALERVTINKRPAVSMDFLKAYGKLYPQQPVALCCWNGEIDAQPLLWWYEPKNPNTLFIPTMDAHDGNPPNVNATVKTDHIISVGSSFRCSNSIFSQPVYYSNILGNAKDLLPTKAFGTQLQGLVKNGDCFIDISDMLNNDKHHTPMLKRGISIENSYTQGSMIGH